MTAVTVGQRVAALRGGKGEIGVSWKQGDWQEDDDIRRQLSSLPIFPQPEGWLVGQKVVSFWTRSFLLTFAAEVLIFVTYLTRVLIDCFSKRLSMRYEHVYDYNAPCFLQTQIGSWSLGVWTSAVVLLLFHCTRAVMARVEFIDYYLSLVHWDENCGRWQRIQLRRSMLLSNRCDWLVLKLNVVFSLWAAELRITMFLLYSAFIF